MNTTSQDGEMTVCLLTKCNTLGSITRGVSMPALHCQLDFFFCLDEATRAFAIAIVFS